MSGYTRESMVRKINRTIADEELPPPEALRLLIAEATKLEVPDPLLEALEVLLKSAEAQ